MASSAGAAELSEQPTPAAPVSAAAASDATVTEMPVAAPEAPAAAEAAAPSAEQPEVRPDDVEPAVVAAEPAEPAVAATAEPAGADAEPAAADAPAAEAAVAVTVVEYPKHTPHVEKHKAGGDLIKSIVYGGLDAIINSESTVSAVFGGGLSSHVALTLGFANLVADGIAMALGDYISSKAEFDLALAERKRELWEYDNNPAGEKAEMVELLEGKGIDTPDATRFIDIISKNREFFVDYMMIEELGLDVPDDPWGPVKDGTVMILSYTAFGTIPLLPYAFAEAGSYTAAGPLFGASIAATLFSLACLGVLQGYMTGQHLVKNAFFMFVNGGIAAGAALLIGWGISQATGDHGCR